MIDSYRAVSKAMILFPAIHPMGIIRQQQTGTDPYQ